MLVLLTLDFILTNLLINASLHHYSVCILPVQITYVDVIGIYQHVK